MTVEISGIAGFEKPSCEMGDMLTYCVASICFVRSGNERSARRNSDFHGAFFALDFTKKKI